ncbi:MAG: pilus assembly protein [Chloroflexota bacterium]
MRAQAGQGLIEFALVILLLAVATIALLTLAGPGIESLVKQVAEFVTRR